MNNRGLSAAGLNLLDQNRIHTCHLVRIDFSAGVVRMTDWAFDLTHDGAEYFAVSHLLGISPVIETAGLEINSVSVSLSGIDQIYLSALLQYNYVNLPVRIYRGLLNWSHDLVDTVEIFRGRLDAPTIEDDPTAGKLAIALRVNSDMGDIDGKRGRHTNDAQHRARFPNDRSFEYVTGIPRQIYWGRPNP